VGLCWGGRGPNGPKRPVGGGGGPAGCVFPYTVSTKGGWSGGRGRRHFRGWGDRRGPRGRPPGRPADHRVFFRGGAVGPPRPPPRGNQRTKGQFSGVRGGRGRRGGVKEVRLKPGGPVPVVEGGLPFHSSGKGRSIVLLLGGYSPVWAKTTRKGAGAETGGGAGKKGGGKGGGGGAAPRFVFPV